MRIVMIFVVTLLANAGICAQIRSNTAILLNDAGVTQFKSGRFEAAIELFEQATRAAPRYVQAYINLAGRPIFS